MSTMRRTPLSKTAQALYERLQGARGQRLANGHYDRRTAAALIRRGLAHEVSSQESAIGSTFFGRDGSCRYYTAYTLVLGQRRQTGRS